jgi:hypothetical protein
MSADLVEHVCGTCTIRDVIKKWAPTLTDREVWQLEDESGYQQLLWIRKELERTGKLAG